MNPAEIVTHCRELGITLIAKDGRLSVNAPKGLISADLRRELADHKAEILAELAVNDGASPLQGANNNDPKKIIRTEILEATRSALQEHVKACPVCQGEPTQACREYAELHQAFDAHTHSIGGLNIKAPTSHKPGAIVLRYELVGIGEQLTAVDTLAGTPQEAAGKLRDFYRVTAEKLGAYLASEQRIEVIEHGKETAATDSEKGA